MILYACSEITTLNVYCVVLPTSTAVVLVVHSVSSSYNNKYTTYPSASVAFTAVQLMVILVAFLWSTVKLVGVKLGAEMKTVTVSTQYFTTIPELGGHLPVHDSDNSEATVNTTK